MFQVPPNYFISKFQQYVGFVVTQSNGNMMGSCPFCLEGNSWGKKKRFNYYNDKEFCACFNCGISCDKTNFILKMENIDFRELIRDIRDSGETIDTDNTEWVNTSLIPEPPTEIILPDDSIDLFDKKQVEFYKGDYFVELALKTIRDRRLEFSKNRGGLYLSREDFLHKNRIIIPFMDEYGDMSFYQSRSQTKKQNDFGKYLGSPNGTKTFYGLDKVDRSKNEIFYIEGPLDCFFVDNSIGGGGILLNSSQKQILADLGGFNEIVYCLDNDFDNKDVVNKYIEYIKTGSKVFFWGGEFSKYKDFNEYCVGEELDGVDTEKLLSHCYSGKEASIRLMRNIKR